MLLLAATVAAGCDDTFVPFAENPLGAYSVFGYLDTTADTQWIRVMPIRQTLVAGPEPIDAVVTLEHVETGRVVTLHDSAFAFVDRRLDAVLYAHNFWTTEPIDPEQTYILTATRSDGAETTATVEMPREPPISLEYRERNISGGVFEPVRLDLDSHNPVYFVVWYTVWDRERNRPAEPVGEWSQPFAFIGDALAYRLPGTAADDALNSGRYEDQFRREATVAVAGLDWPYEGDFSPTEIAIPGVVPNTVENGIGSLVGVSILDIPLALCHVIEPRPGDQNDCRLVVDATAATVEGRVSPGTCHESSLVRVLLTERFPDGGAVVWEWKADWTGRYRFTGLVPGSELQLQFPDAPDETVSIPALEPGERYIVPDVNLPEAC